MHLNGAKSSLNWAERMDQRHPHTDALYRVVIRHDQTFGVEVKIPEMNPTIVTNFTTAADAEAWIAAHKQRVAGSASLSRARWSKKHYGRERLVANGPVLADTRTLHVVERLTRRRWAGAGAEQPQLSAALCRSKRQAAKPVCPELARFRPPGFRCLWNKAALVQKLTSIHHSWSESPLSAELRVVHLAKHRRCDLPGISSRTGRWNAPSPLRTSDFEEPDIWADASCVQLDDVLTIDNAVGVRITRAERTQIYLPFWAARCQKATFGAFEQQPNSATSASS